MIDIDAVAERIVRELCEALDALITVNHAEEAKEIVVRVLSEVAAEEEAADAERVERELL